MIVQKALRLVHKFRFSEIKPFLMMVYFRKLYVNFLPTKRREMCLLKFVGLYVQSIRGQQPQNALSMFSPSSVDMEGVDASFISLSDTHQIQVSVFQNKKYIYVTWAYHVMKISYIHLPAQVCTCTCSCENTKIIIFRINAAPRRLTLVNKFYGVGKFTLLSC